MTKNGTILEYDSSGLAERFAKLYDADPLLVQAPGRVNLIGEHTDYNEGFVFPAAIGFQTRVAIARRADRRRSTSSENYSERIELDLDKLPGSSRGHWSDYVVGVVGLLERTVDGLPGANLLLHGNVPQGAGLSSSASLEVAVCRAFLEVSEKTLDGVVMAKLCQRAENEFVGTRCGIMDQFISVHGRKNHALRLDCRTLEYDLLPLPGGCSVGNLRHPGSTSTGRRSIQPAAGRMRNSGAIFRRTFAGGEISPRRNPRRLQQNWRRTSGVVSDALPPCHQREFTRPSGRAGTENE